MIRCFDLGTDRVRAVDIHHSVMENPHEAEQTRLLERIIKNVVSQYWKLYNERLTGRTSATRPC